MCLLLHEELGDSQSMTDDSGRTLDSRPGCTTVARHFGLGCQRTARCQNRGTRRCGTAEEDEGRRGTARDGEGRRGGLGTVMDGEDSGGGETTRDSEGRRETTRDSEWCVVPPSTASPILYSSSMFPCPMCIHLHFPKCNNICHFFII